MTRVHARWAAETARRWAGERPVPVGCNFIPSTAINQIEMWAAGTFDPATIDRELGWAHGLGFNTVRVYLHDESWRVDPTGFLERVESFLSIAVRHAIVPLLVLFDDCWYEPMPGRQPSPRPGVHNSGWVRSPGKAILEDRTRWDELERYVRAVVRAFGDDTRVLGWDVYNEVTNTYMPALSLPESERRATVAAITATKRAADLHSIELMERAFEWVRSEGAAQPLTAGEYRDDDEVLNRRLAELSDVVSFHNYRGVDHLTAQIARLETLGRPLWCTEYLNRRTGCRFDTHLPVLLRRGVGAWNWGLVDGKTQTKWAWSDPRGGPPPEVWFHDILHPDGSPYDDAEVGFLRATLHSPSTSSDT